MKNTSVYQPFFLNLSQYLNTVGRLDSLSSSRPVDVMLYNAMVLLTRVSRKRRSLKLLVPLRRSKPRLPKEENTFKPELTTSTTFQLAIDHAFTVTNKSSSENGTDDLSSTTNLDATYYSLSPRDQVEEKERDIPYSPCICVPSLGRRGHERVPCTTLHRVCVPRRRAQTWAPQGGGKWCTSAFARPLCGKGWRRKEVAVRLLPRRPGFEHKPARVPPRHRYAIYYD